MHRSAPATSEKAHAPAPRIRLARVLACAAVPVMLVAVGCSSDSGGDKKASGSSSSSSSSASGGKQSSASPSLAPAKLTKLPEACPSISAKAIDEYVPKAKAKAGVVGKTSDPQSQASCTWNGLDDKGVDGSQYRWLDIDFKRYDSTPGLGSGDALAQKQFDRAVSAAQSTSDAQNVKSAPTSGLGDQATTITFDLKKDDATFRYAVVVARTANAVVAIDYNGTGYQGADAPDNDNVQGAATALAKEAVAAVTAANNK
ncbi:DUF3558 domain-containing protein [Streptomyces sp. NBC_00083]|uniref:DUF3558 domain-containing protein n=1 Tax=Streptomyces sp. NBC_00083 TaxID=2975647 RepID=UPI002256DFE2|nr:DUF3558 domain-containing protein [Streptomyces sp. NBC_00083]MCX5384896.1 DUF3558 domain-containing protein [Streptomyces sp. NBC_00083]